MYKIPKKNVSQTLKSLGDGQIHTIFLLVKNFE